MSNSTTPTIDIGLAASIILTMDRYMIVILYITGMTGAILNIITFLQKQLRINPCAVYFLSTSIVDLCIMNVFILMEIITTFAKPLFTTIYSTRIWCKMGNYLMFILPCLSSSYITLASFDRFCISSLNQTLKKWSRLKVSRIVVISICILWILFGLHIPIVYDRTHDQCRVVIGSPTTYIIIDGFFFALYNGAIVPFLLCILGLMIYYNIQASRRRVYNNNNNDNNHIQMNTRSNKANPSITPIVSQPRSTANRNNIHMLCMLLVQVFLTIILNIPYIVVYLYNYFNRPPTDLLLLLLYIIFSFIARWFYYMNYCKTFYINTLTSGLFRRSLRRQVLNLFHLHGRL